MNHSEIHHRLETIINSTGGREYTVTVRGRLRPDGRWEGCLEFSPVGAGGRVVTTPVQTTQSSVRQLLYWAGGLSRTHLEDSLMTGLYPPPVRAPQPRAGATPVSADERRQHLDAIERDVLAMFREARTTRLRTHDVFRRGPHSNADFVRAFEDLEKQRRYLARHTADGVDWLELTMAGAHAAGLPAALGDEEPVDLPRPPR
jgi:hypothetical protein